MREVRQAAAADLIMAAKGWQRPFDDPIPLPRGRQLVTLKDAAGNIMKLPHDHGLLNNPPARLSVGYRTVNWCE